MNEVLYIDPHEVLERVKQQKESTRLKLQTNLWELLHVLYPPPKYKWYEHIHKSITDEFFIHKLPGQQPQLWDTRKKRLWLDPRNTYKALALDTLIPTPTGLRRLESIHVGDEVFGSDGNPYKVTGESEIFTNRRAFKVSFSLGHSVVCDADHLWVTSKYGAEPQVRKTSAIADDLFGCARKDRKHFISPARELRLPDKHYLIHPYVLGAWLGDGHTDTSRITVGDDEIVAKLKEIEGEIRFVANCGEANTWSIGPKGHKSNLISLQSRLRKLGVLGNKHISNEYLCGSFEQRLELLRGLMDTDGSCSRGECIFTNTNYTLAEQVLFLVSSLGVRASFRTLKSIYNNKPYTCYQVAFFCPSTLRVFHVERKFGHQKQTVKRKKWVIENVTEVPPVPMKCLMIASPDKTYLVTEACIPTHNTTIGIADMVQWILCYPDVRILIGSGTRDNAIAILGSVKSHFQYNEIIRFYFPELCPEDRKAAEFGSKDEFTCPGRRDKTIKEPTVSVASPDSTVASRHFELCHFDDLVNETNSRTKDGINQVNHWFSMTNPLIEVDCYRTVTGTRYDYSDLAGIILGENYSNEQMFCRMLGEYLVTVRGAYKLDGTSLFPERFTQTFLDAERKEMGNMNFASQYMNNPVPDGTSHFPKNVIDRCFISRMKLPTQRSYFQTLDLAASQSDDADNNALVTCSVGYLPGNPDPVLFVEDIYAGHIGPEEIIGKMFEKLSQYGVRIIRTEEVAFTVLLKPLASLIGQKKGRYLPLQWIKRDSKESKEARIVTMSPFFERGQIRIVDDCPFSDSLVTELLRFPKYRRRDIADALADQIEFLEMFNQPQEMEQVQFAAPSGIARLGLMS